MLQDVSDQAYGGTVSLSGRMTSIGNVDEYVAAAQKTFLKKSFASSRIRSLTSTSR